MLKSLLAAMRRLAPVNPALAGLAADIVLGASGVLVCSLHCPEKGDSVHRDLVYVRHCYHRASRHDRQTRLVALVMHIDFDTEMCNLYSAVILFNSGG